AMSDTLRTPSRTRTARVQDSLLGVSDDKAGFRLRTGICTDVHAKMRLAGRKAMIRRRQEKKPLTTPPFDQGCSYSGNLGDDHARQKSRRSPERERLPEGAGTRGDRP